VEDGSPLAERAFEPTALAFCADGALLAAGDAAVETRVYRVPDLVEAASLPALHRGTPILGVAFGRDPLARDDTERTAGRWLLATADQGADIVIWDLVRRLPRSFCRGSTWLASALAFHPDGMTLASAGRNEARLWDVASGKSLLRVPEQSMSTSRALAFDASGLRLICGGEAGGGRATVSLWKLERDRGIQVLRGLASPVRKVWFSPDGLRLAALSDSLHLAVWKVKEDRLLHVFEMSVRDLADQAGGCFDAQGARFAIASGDEARLYDLDQGRVLNRWRLAEGMANHMQMDARGRWLLLRREKSETRERDVWRLQELGAAPSPTPIHEQTDSNWSAYNMAFAPGGERFLVWHKPVQGGGTNVVIHAYAMEDGRELWKHTTEVTDPDLRVAFDPCGRWFGHDGDATHRLHLIRWSDFVEIGATPGDPRGYDAISPSGAEFGGSGWFFPDLTGMKNGIRFAADRTSLAWVSTFSPDGKLLAQGTEDGVVLLLDIPEVKRRLAGLGKPGAPSPGQ
jgi:WD40 repeat protein